MPVNTKDKYYTPDWLVKYTIDKAIEILGKDNITEVIEPSAGDGAFIEMLRNTFDNSIPLKFYDLYPEHPDIIKMDYKKLMLSYKKGRLVIGNPPFGTSSSLWKAFCKKSAKIADYIAFISPASQYNSNYYFKEGVLVYSELLNDVEYIGSEVEGGKAQKVRTCLNIYKVYDREEQEDWRLERLEQDVKIFGTAKDDKEVDADFHLRWWANGGNHHAGQWDPERMFAMHLSVKVLNTNVYEKVKQFCETFETIYDDEMKSMYTGHGYLSTNFFKNKLKKFLFPTREERLEQDVKLIYHNVSQTGVFEDGNFYIQSYRNIIRLTNTCPLSGVYISIKILNENKIEEIENALRSSLNELHSVKTIYDGLSMNIKELKEYLIKHLYPTREERLEQDIQIVGLDSRDPTMNEKLNNYDWYLDRFKTIGKCSQTPRGDCFAIKVINETVRSKVDKVMKEFDEKYKNDICRLSNGTPVLSQFKLKDILIKHLYPTRKERLEQDVKILPRANLGYTGEYYICHLGDAGLTTKELKYASSTPINILDEDLRQTFENSFNKIKELIQNHSGLQTSTGGSTNISLFAIKEVLMQVLYPEDDFSDYPEVRKPVHVEREIHGKPLIEQTYIPEPKVKEKEIINKKGKELF